MELTEGRNKVLIAVAAVLLVAMFGWNIAQQREISVLRGDISSLDQRLADKRKAEVKSAAEDLARIASQPTPPASPRPRTKAKAKARDGEPRARTAKAGKASKASAREARAVRAAEGTAPQ